MTRQLNLKRGKLIYIEREGEGEREREERGGREEERG